MRPKTFAAWLINPYMISQGTMLLCKKDAMLPMSPANKDIKTRTWNIIICQRVGWHVEMQLKPWPLPLTNEANPVTVCKCYFHSLQWRRMKKMNLPQQKQENQHVFWMLRPRMTRNLEKKRWHAFLKPNRIRVSFGSIWCFRGSIPPAPRGSWGGTQLWGRSTLIAKCSGMVRITWTAIQAEHVRSVTSDVLEIFWWLYYLYCQPAKISYIFFITGTISWRIIWDFGRWPEQSITVMPSKLIRQNGVDESRAIQAANRINGEWSQICGFISWALAITFLSCVDLVVLPNGRVESPRSSVKLWFSGSLL